MSRRTKSPPAVEGLVLGREAEERDRTSASNYRAGQIEEELFDGTLVI